MHPAMAARLNKEAHPERFCPDERCLWRLSSGPCPKHQGGPHTLPWPEPVLELCELCEDRPAAHTVSFMDYGPRKADVCCYCVGCETERCIPFEKLVPGEPDPRD